MSWVNVVVVNWYFSFQFQEIKPAVPYLGDFETEKEYKAAKLWMLEKITIFLLIKFPKKLQEYNDIFYKLKPKFL